MKNKIIRTTTLIAMLSTSSIALAAGGGSITLKAGDFKLSELTQDIGGVDFGFRDSSQSVFAFEYEKSFKKNLYWGVELINYSTFIDSLNGSPILANVTVDTLLFMGNVKKYFDVSKSVKPYIGGGVGLTTIELSSGGSGSGFAIQAVAGVKFPFDNISAIVEYKLVSAEADNAGDTFDVSGAGLYAGIAFNF